MHRQGHIGTRFLRNYSSGWNPIVSLKLRQPTLVMLETCTTRDRFKQILAQMMRLNLITQTFPMSRLILYSAISHPENLDIATLLFTHFTPHPNLYIYNTMISSLSFSFSQSYALYNSMLLSFIYPDKNTLLHLLQACNCLSEGKQIHCQAIVTGIVSSYSYLQNSLVKMYVDYRKMGLALQLFDKMSTPDSVTFNILIAGYAKMGYSLEALELFREMVVNGFEPDEFTTLGLLMSCGRLGDLRLGKAVHSWMERRDLLNTRNLILCNAFLDMYIKCNKLDHAQKIFSSCIEKDVISWNTMIAGYVGIGELEVAHSLFDTMPKKDIVSWNSLIAEYSQRGDCIAVRRLSSDMIAEEIWPDDITVTNIVSLAAEIGAIDLGRWMHGWVIRTQIKLDAFMASSLIEMYCNCGFIEKALTVFKKTTKKDVTLWTAMISGLAFHGYGRDALCLFSEMQKDIIPNEVTFLAVLTACSHSGLLDQGLRIFNKMKENYGIEPGVEHYGSLVDLLGRSGRLAAAKDVIEKMPMKPSGSVWGALLSACKAHKNVEIAETALMELSKLEPEKGGGYVLLSNIYAACGRWSHSDKVRERMENRGIKKTAGCSDLIVNGVIYEFVASNKWHPKWVEIQSVLISLRNEMRFVVDLSLELVQFLHV